MKKTFFQQTFLLLLAGVVFFSSCRKDEDDPHEPEHSHDHHHVTTLKLLFTAEGSSETIEFVYDDSDDHSHDQDDHQHNEHDDDHHDHTRTFRLKSRKDDIILDADKVYYCDIQVLDKSNPDQIKNYTDEIKEEGEEHMFYFTVSEGLNLEHQYEDADRNGEPVGLENKVITGANSSGELKVVLKEYHHRHDKGDAAKGETEIEVEFHVNIK